MSNLLHLVCGGHVVALDVDSGAEVWRANVGMAVYAFGPAVGADVVVVHGPLKLHCFDKDTGALRWVVPAQVNDPQAHVGFFGDVVVVGSRGVVHAYALADGRSRWEAPLSGLGYGAVVLGRPAKPQR